MNVELIIFDCDGVLVDSERISNQVFRECLEQELGLVLSFDKVVKTFKGHTMTTCIDKLAEILGKPVPLDFIEYVRSRMFARLESDVTPVEGVSELLKNLKVPCCVASSGIHKKIRTTLGKTELLGFFEGRIFSVEDVERGKPFPDIFLHAAETLGVEPSKCVVVEDSVTGVQAAIAAKMKVFGYVDLSTESELAAAGALTFNSMSDLPQLIGF